MPTLLLRLVAPMQSWGVSSRFTVRDTAREPTKSGVIGLLAAALGRPRHHPVDDLVTLHMGARVDRDGRIEVDYHTANNVYRANPEYSAEETVVSRRYYLADAAFLVGLESPDRSFLEALQKALRNPHWPLFLGRKAFVPGEPIWLPDGLQPTPLLETLSDYPWLGHDRKEWEHIRKLRVMVDDPDGAIVRYDLPISFHSRRRRYAPRRVQNLFVDRPPFREPLAAQEVT